MGLGDPHRNVDLINQISIVIVDTMLAILMWVGVRFSILVGDDIFTTIVVLSWDDRKVVCN